MPTQREYLVEKGLAKPGRGRFSAAAKEALAVAVAEGVVFTDVKEVSESPDSESPGPRPESGGGRTHSAGGVPVQVVGGSSTRLRRVSSLRGKTADGVTIGFDTCRRCLGHLTLCSCRLPKAPHGVVEILDLPDWTPIG